MAQEIILTKGIPASGKSAWAKKMVSQSDQFKRVNKDDLREMIDCSEWSQPNEKFILSVRDYIVSEALRKGKNVIIDDTNFEDKHFDRMCDIARSFDKDIVVREQYFPCEVNIAIERDAKRAKPLGEKIVRYFHNKYVHNRSVKERCENFYALPATNTVKPFTGLKKAIICDLDGTLAILNGRNPYDAARCESDLINVPVRDVLVAMYCLDYTIIFVSGREDKYKLQTERFIQDHVTAGTQQVPISYQLYMRKSGDMRKDNVVKREIYDEHIKDKYSIEFVLDDRPQVVRMWRYDLGMTVFQLNDKEF